MRRLLDRRKNSVVIEGKTGPGSSQGKIQDVVVSAKKSAWNSGIRLAVGVIVRGVRSGPESVKISVKAVFDVRDSRLAIGTFSRPLLDQEARSFRQAWEKEALPGFEDFQVDRERVSFVSRPESVSGAWKEIDRLLASATENVRKAS